MAQFRTTFRLVDTDGDGRVSKDEVAGMLDKLGQSATDEELSLMVAEATGSAEADAIDFDSFMGMMGDALADKEPEDMLRDAYGGTAGRRGEGGGGRGR